MGDLVATRLHVLGVHTDDDVKQALQRLFDIFGSTGIGQATFEMTGRTTADLVLKHSSSVPLDLEAIAAALAKAGDYRLAPG